VVHKRIHTGEKPYHCDHPGCEAAFAQSSHLVVHKRIHTGEKPFPCDHPGCEAAFAGSESLVVHKRIHTGEKPYPCDHPGCEAAIAQRGGLVTHKRVHTGEKPFPCDHPGCEAAFTTSGSLAKHKRIHTGEKPYPCDHPGCEAAFAQRGDLVAHKRIHTGEKPYPCDHPDCKAKFSMSGNLVIHKRIHTGEKPYPCDHPGCEAAFATSGNLVVHRRTHTPQGQARHKKEEERVRKLLRKAGYDIVSEYRIDFRCVDSSASCAYIDVLILRGGGVIFLEVDEEQHRFGYTVVCDMKRMARVAETLALGGNTLPVLWLRYNPGAFRVDGELQRVPKKQREAELLAFIRAWEFPKEGGQSCFIKYMYYDMDGGVLAVHNDPGYHPLMRACAV
jgi:uncharacterized Zn-finger protein